MVVKIFVKPFLKKIKNARFFSFCNYSADYLRFMIIGRILFWVIVFYVLYKFVVNLVIPVLQAVFKVQSAMKNMTPTQNNANRLATREGFYFWVQTLVTD